MWIWNWRYETGDITRHWKNKISRDIEKTSYTLIFLISITTQIIVLWMYMFYRHIFLVSFKAYPGMVWPPQDMSWLTVTKILNKHLYLSCAWWYLWHQSLIPPAQATTVITASIITLDSCIERDIGLRIHVNWSPSNPCKPIFWVDWSLGPIS